MLLIAIETMVLNFPTWIGKWLLSVSGFHQSEEEIDSDVRMVRLSQRNSKYFHYIYEKYYDRIFVFVNRRVDELNVTSEITSNVFYNCLKNIHKYQFKGVPFSAWLYRIAVNEMNMYFRKEKKAWRHVAIQEEHIEMLFHDVATDIDVHLDSAKLITHFLEKLSEEELLLLELRFFEKRSYDEVGYLSGLKPNTAKVKTYRVIEKLKKEAKNLNLSEFGWQD